MWRAVPLLVLSALASAQTPGPPPVSIVVPFPRGGGSDFIARQLAEGLPPVLGEPTLIVHRPGDDGLAGVDEVLRTAPDGITLLIGSTSSMIMAPLAKGRPPIDSVAELEPLLLVASTPRVVVVHPSVPAKNLDELIRVARSDPASLACGTADRLSVHAARSFERLAGVRLSCVHYSGGAALRKDMLIGQRKLAFESALLPEVQAGQLRALAVAGRYRVRLLPDVPTASEAGMSGFEAIAWLAVFAPKGTAAERAERLAKALLTVSQNPAFIAAIESRGYVARVLHGQAMRQFLDADLQAWRKTTVTRP